MANIPLPCRISVAGEDGKVDAILDADSDILPFMKNIRMEVPSAWSLRNMQGIQHDMSSSETEMVDNPFYVSEDIDEDETI